MELDRRPLKSRNTNWARAFAAFLAKIGITPNQISVLSIFFSMGSFYFYQSSYSSPYPVTALILGALGIQLRLLCNLFDGMVAVEHDQTSPLGDLYNDVPDRLADIFIIVGAAMAVKHLPFAIELGWLGASLAILTAYIRVIGKSVGTQTFYTGPMAKPHRMALITICTFLEIATIKFHLIFSPIYLGLIILNIGGIMTCYRRLKKIAAEKTSLAIHG